MRNTGRGHHIGAPKVRTRAPSAQPLMKPTILVQIDPDTQWAVTPRRRLLVTLAEALEMAAIDPQPTAHSAIFFGVAENVLRLPAFREGMEEAVAMAMHADRGHRDLPPDFRGCSSCSPDARAIVARMLERGEAHD